jgi:hypothetical protein
MPLSLSSSRGDQSQHHIDSSPLPVTLQLPTLHGQQFGARTQRLLRVPEQCDGRGDVAAVVAAASTTMHVEVAIAATTDAAIIMVVVASSIVDVISVTAVSSTADGPKRRTCTTITTTTHVTTANRAAPTEHGKNSANVASAAMRCRRRR